MTQEAIATYDLHITIEPSLFDQKWLSKKQLWSVHDIHNTQGIPHFIISRKQVSTTILEALQELMSMTAQLRACGAVVYREKIEQLFGSPEEVCDLKTDIGIIEVHYKYKARGRFAVYPQQIAELNDKGLAFSFNLSKNSRIVSARFTDLAAYEVGHLLDALPDYIEAEEREIVIFDTNNQLDSFWPLRMKDNPPVDFGDFPIWIATT